MSHSIFNEKLYQFPHRIIPIIDPKQMTSDFSISKPVTCGATSDHLIATDECGEFANISIQGHMIQSYWTKSTMKSFDDIDTTKLLQIFKHTFKSFKFQRSRTPCLGINIYNGNPDGQCYVDYPYRCGKEATLHQYYRKCWDVSLLPFLNSCLHILVTEAVQTSEYIDALYKRLLDLATGNYFDPQVRSLSIYRSYGGLELVTLGTSDIPGYANMEHDDPKDMNPDLQAPCLSILNDSSFEYVHDDERKRLMYSKLVVEHVCVGMPTTCGYYLHMSKWNEDILPNKKRKLQTLESEEDELVAIFLMQGLGCGVRLRHSMYHQFHGYAFRHNTCVPYVIKDGYVHFKDTPFNLIAWGDSDQTSKQRRERGIELGIITRDQRLTQRRITEWFAVPGRENHPNRNMFGV